MADMMNLNIKNIVGPYCGTRREGNIIYHEILEQWDKYDKININFEGVEITTLSFFHAAFSSLIDDYPIEKIQNKLFFMNLDDKAKVLLNKSFKTALNQLNGSTSSNH